MLLKVTPRLNKITNNIFYLILFNLCSIISILKSNDVSKIENYSPIAIISHIAKLFESLVLKHIEPSINSILVDEEYEFRPGYSTIT